MKQFINRKNELNTLWREYSRKEASFVVIYGRRRVGKTALINEFCKDKRTIFYLATEENEEENRNALKNVAADILNHKFLKEMAAGRWETIFDVIAEACNRETERLILVIDEFQYLGKANPAFPSILMRIWDEKLKDKNIMLVLCGSLIHMMTAQVLCYDSPLYGRRTAQMRIGQISYQYYKEFAPDLTEEERLQRYAVTGGVPKYIEIFREEQSHAEPDIYELIRRHIMSRNAFLYMEPEFLLQKEVTEIGSYFSILKTIAAGNHKLSKIATAMNIKQTSLSKYLNVLSELDLIEREVPITEESPEKSKKGLYFIKDNFIKFWFQFIYPYKGMLENDQDDYVLDKIRNHFIDSHVSYVYENICRQKVWEWNGKGFSVNRVGRWWGKSDVEIDIVAYDSTGQDIIFGECKYTHAPKGMEILRNLEEKACAVDWHKKERKEYFMLFSKSGFTAELEKYAAFHDNVFLVKNMELLLEDDK
ncbi:MAG: ATP-binding protein [Bacillus sp. (in: Bacteria)]|nr:ATP-binding protein [Bacillus sp. (in: firmicutes)]MCM1425842.1 ATP-binding protein [Eubacterium sp.]